jgi:uncharacterized protein (DUF305 family)
MYTKEAIMGTINIDKKTGIFAIIILALVATIAAMAIGSDRQNGLPGMHTNGMHNDQDANSSKLNGADVMFLQMMIPHHQQAIDISELAITTSKDAELVALATAIRDGQASEIVQMKNWLVQVGADIEMGHMGHDMGGMLSDTELSALKASRGSAFDRLWLEGMTNHHNGALHMTTMISDAQDPAIQKFGQKIIEVQSAQNAQMKTMLSRLG